MGEPVSFETIDSRMARIKHQVGVKLSQVYTDAQLAKPGGGITPQVSRVLYEEDADDFVLRYDDDDDAAGGGNENDAPYDAPYGDEPLLLPIDLHGTAPVRRCVGHGDLTLDLAFVSERMLMSAALDDTVCFWAFAEARPDEGVCVQLVGDLDGMTGAVLLAARGTFATCSSSALVREYDIETGALLASLACEGVPAMYSLAAHGGNGEQTSNTLLATAGDKGIVLLWDLRQAGPVMALAAPRNETLRGSSSLFADAGTLTMTRALCFNDAGDCMGAAVNDAIVLWELRTGTPVLEIGAAHDDWVDSLSFAHHDASLISCARDSTVRVWSAASGVCTDILASHRAPVLGGLVVSVKSAVSPCGRYALAGHAGGSLVCYDTVTAESVITFTGVNDDDRAEGGAAEFVRAAWSSSGVGPLFAAADSSYEIIVYQ